MAEYKKDEIIKNIEGYFFSNGINLTPLQCEQFCNYYLLLTEWNEKINLTAITELNEVIVKHFYDSAVCYNLFKDDASVIDIGCGAGFPSIPLKILRPDLKLTLVDSVNKKINFINELIKKLNLTNTIAIHSRAEDLANNLQYRENFDYCISRAVAGLSTLCEYCLPFVCIGGTMLSYKSIGTEEELKQANNAIILLGGKVKKVVDFTVADYCRKVILISKILKTANKYPRKGNKPRTDPLV